MLRQGSSRGFLSRHGFHLHNPFVETAHIGIAKPWIGVTFTFHLMNWIGIIRVQQSFVADFPIHLHHLKFWKFHLVLHTYICFLHYVNVVEQQDKQISHFQQCNLRQNSISLFKHFSSCQAENIVMMEEPTSLS